MRMRLSYSLSLSTTCMRISGVYSESSLSCRYLVSTFESSITIGKGGRVEKQLSGDHGGAHRYCTYLQWLPKIMGHVLLAPKR